MSLMTLANIRHQFGTHLVLDGATAAIDAGEKIGLVGRNGSGKSTFMKVMMGRLTPDGGTVQFQRGARVGYLEQDPRFEPGTTVRDVAASAFTELADLHRRLDAVYDEMATADGDALEQLMKRQTRLEAEIEAAGGYAVDHRIDAMLHGLGFRDDQFTLEVQQLSGGQRGRLGLARLLLEAPDLLLLDEPTNHLDIDGRRWLETFLAEEYSGAVILVSHDRWLLDRVVRRIIEVEAGRIREYPGNYHKYLELRRERQLTQSRVYEKQLDKIRAEEQFIRRYKSGQRAKQARGRESRLERYKRDELVERPLELDVMNLQLPPAPRSGDQVAMADGITKRYGDLTLFESFSVALKRGDRIGIIGPNGIGKSTLIKCLLDELEPDEGSVRLGSRVSVGYYRQTHEHLDRSLTVWQYLQSVIVSLDGAVRASEQQARNLAGAFLFSGAEQDKTLESVSGGERSRAVLAGLVAGAHNLLVLDEPTNHLDIPSAERLEQALSPDGGFDGTLLLISHDRQLLQSTCDQLIVFRPGRAPRLFEGRYSDWLEYEAAESARDAEAAAASAKASSAKSATKPAKRSAKTQAKDAPKRPHRHLSMEELEAQIMALEERMGAIDRQMMDPDVYSDAARCRELTDERDAVDRDRAELEAEWEHRAETVE